jgi:hypothetical protein
MMIDFEWVDCGVEAALIFFWCAVISLFTVPIMLTVLIVWTADRVADRLRK